MDSLKKAVYRNGKVGMIRYFGEMRVNYPQNIRRFFVMGTKILETDYCQKFDNLRYKNNAIRHSRYVSPFCLYTVIADIKGSAGVDAKKQASNLRQ